jgi:hypothetical protein
MAEHAGRRLDRRVDRDGLVERAVVDGGHLDDRAAGRVLTKAGECRTRGPPTVSLAASSSCWTAAPPSCAPTGAAGARLTPAAITTMSAIAIGSARSEVMRRIRFRR